LAFEQRVSRSDFFVVGAAVIFGVVFGLVVATVEVGVVGGLATLWEIAQSWERVAVHGVLQRLHQSLPL